MGLINEDESIEFTDGALRLIDAAGNTVDDGITASRFTEVIGEAVNLTATRNSPTTSRSAILRAAIAWDRWRG